MHARVRFAVALAALTLGAPFTVAQTKSLADPAELTVTTIAPNKVHVDLDVKYADFTMYNPSTRKNDAVHLRTYNGLPVGPTVRVYPGTTMTTTLKNDLPAEGPPCDTGHSPDHNTPACFNITNLHTHGFHVSPSGNSDNVLLTVLPTQSFDYQFDIPADHPAGTFWYHSHRHGSTALQVSSGMVGALIIKGTRTYADKVAHGGLADIDTVLKQTGGKKVTERIALFQQVQYSCKDQGGNLTWDCAKSTNQDNVGRIEEYKGHFGPTSWTDSGRYTTINGLVQPTVPVHAGQIYRWRLIHGGVRDTIGLRITRSTMGAAQALALNAALAKGVSAAKEEEFVEKYCRLDQPVPQFEFAADGLTRTSMVKKLINVLQPGYRSDILTVMPEKGTFCVVDDLVSPSGEVNSVQYDAPGAAHDAPVTKGRRLLALITSIDKSDTAPGKAKPVHMSTTEIESYVGNELYKGNPELPEDIREDLGHLKIAAFAPHEAIPDADVQGRERELVDFNINGSPTTFQVNGKPYSDDPHEVRMLKLGETDEWKLTSEVASHPFHIHVNPFEIVKITRTVDGKDVDIFSNGHCTELDLKDSKTGAPKPDPQYCDQIGVFRDTIFVKQGYQVYIRTHYTDFPGGFVLHCHILDHEDQGMMQNVFIQDPKNPVPNPFTDASHDKHHH